MPGPPNSPARWTSDPSAVRPMLATARPDAGPADLVRDRFVYEPKYDGMRVLVAIEPAHPTPAVTLRSRLGRDKTAQFPDVVRELKRFARGLRAPILLDGELVAIDARGQATSFQRLAGRIHLDAEREIERQAAAQPVAFVAFDILRDGGDDLRRLPLVDRKARLERVFGTAASGRVRMAEMAAGDGRRLYERAAQDGWEGLVAKDAHSPYESGRRSPAWLKLKIPRRQELVVGGWTDPAGSRHHFGSLAVGYYAGRGRMRTLHFAGLVGSGFTEQDLAALAQRLDAHRQSESPFSPHPALPAGGHWVRPDLVVEVKFTEWTDDGLLRHPVYLGLREDKRAQDVAREDALGISGPEGAGTPGRVSHGPSSGSVSAEDEAGTPGRRRGSTARPAPGRGRRPRSTAVGRGPNLDGDAALGLVVDQLSALEGARRDGTIALPDGSSLEVTNLAKVFWPGPGITKGELLRYYARVSPWLLPAVADRPLVMKRFPNGVLGKSFYQQRAPDEVPAGVRVATVADDDEAVPRLVGGSLQTLLYMAQLAAISQDPWFSRVQAPDVADYVALDLDPMPGVPFSQVLEVARAVRDDLTALDVVAVPKTSGSSGLHVYLPLRPDTPYAAGQLFCQLIATIVATRHPRLATVERVVAKRGRTVYVDYLQNIQGKTIATAYSARASEFAGVSTPLDWHEIDEALHPEDFTVRTVWDRFTRVGDLWAPARTGRGVDLRAALERLARRW